MSVIARGLFLAGVLALAGGTWMLSTGTVARDAARAEVLPRVGAADVARFPADTAVLLEGRLVAREPAGPQGFVVFHRETFLREETSGPNKGRDVWQRTGTVRPAIAVEGNDAVVAVANRDYLLVAWPHQGQTDAVPRDFSLFQSTERFLGFKAGDRVTLDGRVVAGESGGVNRIEATSLFGGTTESYLASLRSDVTTLKIVGGVFTGFGVLLMAAGFPRWRPERKNRGRAD